MLVILQILLTVFILSIPIAVVGLTYAYILTRDGMILEPWYNWAGNHLPNKLYLPVIGCHLCCTGQMALWLFPFFIDSLIGIKYNFFLHIYFISQSIINVAVLKHFYLKIENN